LAAQVDSVDAALLRAEVIAQQAQLEALTAAADAAERREQASMAAVRSLTCRAFVEGTAQSGWRARQTNVCSAVRTRHCARKNHG
jgi:hypothetical protein